MVVSNAHNTRIAADEIVDNMAVALGDDKVIGVQQIPVLEFSCHFGDAEAYVGEVVFQVMVVEVA